MTTAVTGPVELAAAFSVSRESLDRLVLYESLLRQWQKAVNLVAPASLDRVWHRHFADSAQIADLMPPAARTWIDAGSGGGFPGLVVAILHHGRSPDLRVTLIESDARKVAFLREVARQTGVHVDILCTRIEIAATQLTVAGIDVVSARALAPLPRLFDLLGWAFGATTTGIFPKGRGIAREITDAQQGWAFDHDLVASRTDIEGRVLVVRDVRAKTGEQGP